MFPDCFRHDFRRVSNSCKSSNFCSWAVDLKAKKACFEQLAECKMISKCQNAHLPGSLNFSIQSLQQIAVDVKSPDCTIFFVFWLHSLYLHSCTCSSAKMAPQNLQFGCGKPIGCEVGIIHMCGELRHVRNKKSNFNTSSLCTAFLQTGSAQKKKNHTTCIWHLTLTLCAKSNCFHFGWTPSCKGTPKVHFFGWIGHEFATNAGHMLRKCGISLVQSINLSGYLLNPGDKPGKHKMHGEWTIEPSYDPATLVRKNQESIESPRILAESSTMGEQKLKQKWAKVYWFPSKTKTESIRFDAVFKLLVVETWHML
jgi:hypothetical protein